MGDFDKLESAKDDLKKLSSVLRRSADGAGMDLVKSAYTKIDAYIAQRKRQRANG